MKKEYNEPLTQKIEVKICGVVMNSPITPEEEKLTPEPSIGVAPRRL